MFFVREYDTVSKDGKGRVNDQLISHLIRLLRQQQPGGGACLSQML
jgi:hypothetical protein